MTVGDGRSSLLNEEAPNEQVRLLGSYADCILTRRSNYQTVRAGKKKILLQNNKTNKYAIEVVHILFQPLVSIQALITLPFQFYFAEIICGATVYNKLKALK
jgi:hypothetical protein